MGNYPGHPLAQDPAHVAHLGPLAQKLEQVLASQLRTEEMLRELLGRQEKQPRRRAAETKPRRTSNPARRWKMAQSAIEISLREQGPMSWEDLVERCARYGHAESTMRSVRHEVAEKYVEKGRWMWRLKGQEGMGNGTADRLR